MKKMKLLVSVAVFLTAFALAATSCCSALNSSNNAEQQQAQSLANSKVANNNNQNLNERQGRSIATASGNSGNQLGGSSGGTQSLLNSGSNIIEHSSSKSRLEQEKRQVQEFASTRNIIKTIIKLFFGNQDEVNATSRNVLGVISKVLDLLKNTFGQKSRNASARTIRDSAEDAASAGVSMLQGYVKSVLANDGHCAKRYLCQASREATRDGRDLGYVIASVGGYATSYLLDSSRQQNFNQFHEASLKGRSMKEDCAKLYSECTE